MPVLLPTGQQQFFISDLANEVIFKVENRVSDIARAWQWLVDALLEISGNGKLRDEFVELEVLGPTFNLTGYPTPVQEYAEGNLLPPGDLNSATLSLLMWIDYPYNMNRRQLKYAEYQDTDKFLSPTASTPSRWYRFGGNIGFYPIPDKPYQVKARALKMHPINWSALQATAILLPFDWNEILVLAAAEKGFLELEEYEKAGAIGGQLRGDPSNPAKPGMIYGRKKKREKEAWRQNQQLSPFTRPYSYGRR